MTRRYVLNARQAGDLVDLYREALDPADVNTATGRALERHGLVYECYTLHGREFRLLPEGARVADLLARPPGLGLTHDDVPRRQVVDVLHGTVDGVTIRAPRPRS